MKKASVPMLCQYRDRPQIVLANASQGASLSVPFTLEGDKLLVAAAEVDVVSSIRSIFATLDLQCIAQGNILRFDEDTTVPARKTGDKGLRLLPARYGKDATFCSKKLNVPMEIREELSDSFDGQSIELTTAMEVRSLRQAHKVANAILELVPVDAGQAGIKVMTDNAETFAPKDFKEFSAVVRQLLAQGRKCFISTTESSNIVQPLGSVQMLLAEEETDDLVCNVMESPQGALSMSRGIDRFEIPQVLKTTADFLSIRGYCGFASVSLAKTQHGRIIPTAISYGFTPELAAAFTATKVFARDFKVPEWGVAHQTVSNQPQAAETVLARLGDAKVFFSRGVNAGIIPLTLPTVTCSALKYMVLAENTASAQALVQKVATLLQ